MIVFALPLFLFAAVTGTASSGSLDAGPGPKAAVLAYDQALQAKDVNAVQSLLHPNDLDQKTFLPVLSAYAVAMKQYEMALQARFGPAATEQGVRGTALPEQLAAADVKVTGDTARVSFKDNAKPAAIDLHHVDSAWQVSASLVTQTPFETPSDEPLRRYAEMAAVLEQVATEIRKGAFSSAGQAAAAARDRVNRVATGQESQ